MSEQPELFPEGHDYSGEGVWDRWKRAYANRMAHYQKGTLVLDKRAAQRIMELWPTATEEEEEEEEDNEEEQDEQEG